MPCKSLILKLYEVLPLGLYKSAPTAGKITLLNSMFPAGFNLKFAILSSLVALQLFCFLS